MSWRLEDGSDSESTYTREELLRARSGVHVPRPPAALPSGTRTQYRAGMIVPTLRGVHGTRSRYSAGCRCDPCREVERAYQQERWRRDPGRHRRQRRTA